MVLINDKKFACATCIKGHRVSGCTHTDRPLFEIKKKGRPSTQCQFCKDKRKGNSVHNKVRLIDGHRDDAKRQCSCGDVKPAAVILPGEAGGSTTGVEKMDMPDDEELQDISFDFETRKGVPGSNPTFPNGLRDVHEMSAAAEALTSIGDEAVKIPERSVRNLLNPCTCQTSGICKCCQPKRRRPSHSRQSLSASGADVQSGSCCGTSSRPRSRSGSRTPAEGAAPSDTFLDMFKQSTNSTPTEGHSANLQSPISPLGISSLHAPSFLSPDDMHHPRHTSPHVHKTKLYSPYSTNGHSTPRHMKRESSSGAAGRPSLSLKPPSKLRPLTDVGTLLGAAVQPDGSLSTSIPRSAVGLPGINTFDAMAQNGGVKIEPLGSEDVDMPLAFPTAEDVVIGACTCGDDCECPGCATHGKTGDASHSHDGPCGEMCKSSSNCGASVCIPSGIQSIQQLLSLASEKVPPPPPARPHELNAFDMAVSPPSVQVSEDAARTHGYVQLKPLECCNGRCQCAPGKCTCEKDCCGCCIRCACGEDDTDARMGGEGSSCCAPGQTALTPPRPASLGSTTPPRVSPVPAQNVQRLSPLTPPDTIDPRLLSSAHNSPLLSPVDALHIAQAGPSSPRASGSTTPTYPPPPALRRSASTSQGHKKTSSSSLGGRRATVTANTHAQTLSRSTSTSKAGSKAAAAHPPAANPNAHHHRPILPKPSGHAPSASMGHLSIPKTSASGSNHPSRVPSPIPQPRPDQPTIQITPTDAEMSQFAAPPTPQTMSNLLSSNGGFDASSGVNDQEWLAFLNHLSATDPVYLQNILAGNVPPEMSLPPNFDLMPFIQQPGADGQSFQGTYDMINSQTQPRSQPPPLSLGSHSSHSGPPSRDPFNPEDPLSQYNAPQDGDSGLAFSPDTLSAILATFAPDYSAAASTNIIPGQTIYPPNPQEQPQAPRNDLPQNPPPFPPGGFAPGFPQENVFSSFGKHMQPQSQQVQPQAQAPIPSIRHRQPAPPPPTVPAPAPQLPSAIKPSGDFNPNLIDLSKPLNAQDVERILKALQRQNSDTQPEAPGVPPSVPPPASDRVPEIMNSLTQSRSHLTSSGVDFDLGSFLGYRPPDQASVPMDQSNSDDLFSKYMFENPGEGLDLSALDLGTAQPPIPSQGTQQAPSDAYPQMFQVPTYTQQSVAGQQQTGPNGQTGHQSQGWAKYSTTLHGHGGEATEVGQENSNTSWGLRDWTIGDPSS